MDWLIGWLILFMLLLWWVCVSGTEAQTRRRKCSTGRETQPLGTALHQYVDVWSRHFRHLQRYGRRNFGACPAIRGRVCGTLFLYVSLTYSTHQPSMKPNINCEWFCFTAELFAESFRAEAAVGLPSGRPILRESPDVPGSLLHSSYPLRTFNLFDRLLLP